MAHDLAGCGAFPFEHYKWFGGLCRVVWGGRSFVLLHPRALGRDLRRGILGERGDGEVPTLGGPHAYEDTPGCYDAFEASRQGPCASVADATLDEEKEHDECMERNPLEIIICRHHQNMVNVIYHADESNDRPTVNQPRVIIRKCPYS